MPATLTPSQSLARIIGAFENVGVTGMRTALVRAIRCGSGVTAIEYALVGALISIAIVTAVTQVGTNITAFFSTIANSF